MKRVMSIKKTRYSHKNIITIISLYRYISFRIYDNSNETKIEVNFVM